MFGRSISSDLGFLVVLAIVLPILFAMKVFASVGAPPDYNYKLTLYVDGPRGPTAFSSVREVTYMSDFSLEGQKQHNQRQKREAIPIELPGGRVYFAIADEEIYPQHVALTAAARKLDPAAKPELPPIWRVEGEHELPQWIFRDALTGSHWDRGKEVRTWPTIVTFSNPADPSTIRIVDPSEISLTRATIQITDEKLERRIDSYFAPDFWERWQKHKQSLSLNRTRGTEFLDRHSHRYGPDNFR